MLLNNTDFSCRSKQQAGQVMSAFKGNVRQMLRHAEASSVVEYAYNDKAVLSQRLMLTEELYGNTFQVCKVLELWAVGSWSLVSEVHRKISRPQWWW